MGLRWCEVTRILPDGRRHTLKLQARSVYHAAVLYYGSCVGAPGEKLPPFDPDTAVEVRPVFDVRVQDAMAWASREADDRNRR